MGTTSASATDCTPGKWRARSRTSSQAARASHAPATSAERVFQCARRSTQTWCQSEKKTAQYRHAKREKQHTPVELDILNARQASRPKGYKRMNTNECEH